ncbi:MAG: hypothetical protein R3E01_02625 [Pirellulaceae bacterium]
MDPNKKATGQPIAVLGAGELVSHLYRDQVDIDTAEYRFNLFRLSVDMAVTHELRPSDFRDIVKLCQVLTFAILDDGWSPPVVREALLELNLQLDELTQSWKEPGDE